MKKTIIVSIAFLTLAALYPTDLAAQAGIKAGFNYANFHYSGPPDDDDLLRNSQGMIFGVFYSLNLGLLTVQPEVYYSRRGAKIVEGGDSLVFRFNYLEVPILFKKGFLRGPAHPVVFAGPYGSYLLSAKSVLKFEDAKVITDINDEIKNIDLGFIFGGGLEIQLEVAKLIAEVRYTLGLLNFDNEAVAYTYKNKGFSILFGIGF